MNDVDRRPLIVGLGEVLWDLLPAGRQLGGAPANVAFHAAALGARAAVVSCVGDDELGREILSRLGEAGLDCRAIAVDSAHPTGTVSVELGPDGRPSFTIHQNVAWDFVRFDKAARAVATQANAACFGSLAQRNDVSRQTIEEFLTATGADCLKVFDLNLRQSYFNRKIVDDSLRCADVLKLNDEEWPLVCDLLGGLSADQDGLAKLRAEYSLRLVALTRGDKGSVLVTSEETSEREGQPVPVVDTVGAGDAFTAVVAVGLVTGGDLRALHERAEAVAQYVCTQAGATPRIPEELRLLGDSASK
ncbi:MAG: carbohydrate kinase family protein [Planctomycetota bacterium]